MTPLEKMVAETGLNRKALARRCGVGYTTLRLVLQGHKPYPWIVARLAHGMQVPFEDLDQAIKEQASRAAGGAEAEGAREK